MHWDQPLSPESQKVTRRTRRNSLNVYLKTNTTTGRWSPFNDRGDFLTTVTKLYIYIFELYIPEIKSTRDFPDPGVVDGHPAAHEEARAEYSTRCRTGT